MKVKDLIKDLNAFKAEDQEREVVMSCDEEGNNFSPLADVSFGLYDDDSRELCDEENDEDGKPAIILWPTH
ncbi:hypothetical protein ACFLQL_03080 [Verrucomicrobiota bacterium]